MYKERIALVTNLCFVFNGNIRFKVARPQKSGSHVGYVVRPDFHEQKLFNIYFSVLCILQNRLESLLRSHIGLDFTGALKILTLF